MTENNEKKSRLSETEVFKSLPEEQLAAIAQVVQEKVVPANTIIYRQGDPGDSFYIIHSGKIRVFLSGEDGVETDLNQLGPGDCFGEIALLTEEPRTGDIEALEETHLFVLTKEEFDRVLKEHPDVFKMFIRHMSELLRREDRRIQEETEHEYRTTRLSLFDFAFVGIVILLFALIYNLSNPRKISVWPKFYDAEEISKVNLSQAKKKFDVGETLFVDARPSSFYNQRHIRDALSLALPDFDFIYMYMTDDDKTKEYIEDKTREIIVYGRSISALYDEEVAKKLMNNGHENVKILKGYKGIRIFNTEYQLRPLTWSAFSKWERDGYPVEGIGDE
jgi:CRP-like cAMP-binding protein/rhodanese-related sulfurtransferase